ncbi:MAG TPA: hypothetical protein PKH65_05940 [Bacteroidia bacterium]|nr:hypothetical protein [Bacteroidia bacterium]HNT80205.1 hypothetical protein [Bacteroidia bacterium]
MKQAYIIPIAFLIVFAACKKENENPFDSVSSSQVGNTIDTTSRYSITGLHKNIFLPKCAMSACHGGTFEPDFRTVSSTYNTLVYAPVVKNTLGNSFTYRVIPFDRQNSWLIHRLTVDDSLILRMPIYTTPLSNEEMSEVYTWIDKGAKDVNGQTPLKPNENPKIHGYNCFDSNGKRIDSIRLNNSSPFAMPKNQNVSFLVFITDDLTPKQNLLDGHMLFSSDPNNFNNAVRVNSSYVSGPTYWGWMLNFNTNQFQSGQTIYFRYYTRDPDHTQLSEYPVSNSYSYTKNYFSFTIQ